jgi:beta-1,4-N-acetylglucosaminyltransferase
MDRSFRENGQNMAAVSPNGSETDILLVASNGGHLLQLVTLVGRWPDHSRHWVTFNKSDARSLLQGERITWAYHPTNRSAWNLLRNTIVALRLLRRLRPKAVVSTGAGVAVPFCYLGRLFGARVIYIESFSRVSEPSLTARLVHPAAHEFYVQWPQLEKRFRKAEYHGAVF